MGRTLLLLCIGLLLTPLVRAEIYVYRDPDGVVHLSNRRLGNHYHPVMHNVAMNPMPNRTAGGRTRGKAAVAGDRFDFQGMIREMAWRHDLDAALLDAMVTAESNHDPDAISRAGAVGLMQLMPATAQRLGVVDSRDPLENLSGGARYFKYLLGRFHSLPLALAAYNSGEGAVQQYGNRIPPYRETQDYVTKVMFLYRQKRERGSPLL